MAFVNNIQQKKKNKECMDDRVKVLIINNGYPSPYLPNYTTYIASIAECLAKANCDVDKMVIYYNHKISILYKIAVYIKFWFKAFTKNLREYDYIYINHAPYVWPIFFNPTFTKMRTFVHWHGDEAVVKSTFLCVTRLLIRKRIIGCRHICPSEYFKSVVSKEIRIPLPEIIVSPSGGVDTDLFVPEKHNSKNIKKEFILGFSSGMSKGKGSDIIMKLVENAYLIEKKLKSKILFYIIDYGKDMCSYRERLVKCKNVVLVTKMSKQKMPSFYNGIDLLLMCSRRRSESLGLVVLEAMSCGKPVVSFNSFAFPELIIPDKTGEMATVSDDIDTNVDNFTTAIYKVISNYNIYSPRTVVINNYSKEYVIGQYKELLLADKKRK